MNDLPFSTVINSVPVNIFVSSSDLPPEVSIFAVGMTMGEVIKLLGADNPAPSGVDTHWHAQRTISYKHPLRDFDYQGRYPDYDEED